MESLIISTCNFELDIKMVHPYVERYLHLMYPNLYMENSPLYNVSRAVSNDSCFTHANLIYSTQSVAFACAIFSATIVGLDLLFVDEEGDLRLN